MRSGVVAVCMCMTSVRVMGRVYQLPKFAAAATVREAPSRRTITIRSTKEATMATQVQLPTSEEMTERLKAWVERYRVAGRDGGVDARRRGAGRRRRASSIARRASRRRPTTLFQIGSITKVYTTTLIMQLVDEGRIDLDAPAVTYLPDLRFGDAGADAEGHDPAPADALERRRRRLLRGLRARRRLRREVRRGVQDAAVHLPARARCGRTATPGSSCWGASSRP